MVANQDKPEDKKKKLKKHNRTQFQNCSYCILYIINLPSPVFNLSILKTT